MKRRVLHGGFWHPQGMQLHSIQSWFFLPPTLSRGGGWGEVGLLAQGQGMNFVTASSFQACWRVTEMEK